MIKENLDIKIDKNTFYKNIRLTPPSIQPLLTPSDNPPPPLPEASAAETITITIVKLDTISGGRIIWGIVVKGAVLICSYSYSFLLILAGYMGTLLANHQGSNTQYRAGNALALSILDFCVVGAVSAAFVLPFYAKSIFAELNTSIEDQYRIAQLNKKMSSLIKIIVILSTPFTILAISYMSSAKFLLPLFGQNQDIANLIQTPLYIASISLPIYVFRFCLEQMHLAGEKQNFIMFISVLYLFLFGIGLSYPLAFGLGPLPDLAMTGIFLGILAENCATTLTSLIGLLRYEKFKDFNFLRSFLSFDKQDFEQLKSLGKMAYPITLTLISEWLTTMIRTIFAGWLGPDEQAAQNAQQLLIFILFLFAQAFGTVTGLKITEPHYAKYGLLTGGTVAAIIAGLGVATNSPQLTRIFNSNASDHVIDLGNQLMPYTATYGFLYSAAIIIRQSLLAKTFEWPSAGFNLSLWIGVLSSFILSQYTSLKMDGIPIGAIIGIALGLAVMIKPYLQAFHSSQVEEIKEEIPVLTEHKQIEEIKEETPVLTQNKSATKAIRTSSQPIRDEEKPRLSSFWGRCCGSCLDRVIKRIWPEQRHIQKRSLG